MTRLDLFVMRPQEGAHRVAVRAAISVFVPLAMVTLLGHPEWSPYAAFGAFTSLYGRNHRHLSRATMQLTAAAAITAASVAAVLVASLPDARWWAVPVAGLVAYVGASLALAQAWHPGGPLFLVFAFGGVSSSPHHSRDVLPALLVVGGSALFAVVVGFAGGLVRGHRSPALPIQFRHSWLPLRDAVTVVLAGTTAVAIGIGHPYWAMVAAVAPLSVRGINGQITRAVHRVGGTVLGLLPSAALLTLGLRGFALVAVVAVLQFVTEMYVGRNYGLALVFITPLALLMGQAAHPVEPGGLLFDRGVETVLGSVIGVAVLVLANHRLRFRRSGSDVV